MSYQSRTKENINKLVGLMDGLKEVSNSLGNDAAKEMGKFNEDEKNQFQGMKNKSVELQNAIKNAKKAGINLDFINQWG